MFVDKPLLSSEPQFLESSLEGVLGRDRQWTVRTDGKGARRSAYGDLEMETCQPLAEKVQTGCGTEQLS